MTKERLVWPNGTDLQVLKIAFRRGLAYTRA